MGLIIGLQYVIGLRVSEPMSLRQVPLPQGYVDVGSQHHGIAGGTTELAVTEALHIIIPFKGDTVRIVPEDVTLQAVNLMDFDAVLTLKKSHGGRRRIGC